MGIGYPQISGAPQIRKVSSMKTPPHPSQSAIEFGSSLYTYIHVTPLSIFITPLLHIPLHALTQVCAQNQTLFCGLLPGLSEFWVWPQHRFSASCLPASQGQDSPWIAQEART